MKSTIRVAVIDSGMKSSLGNDKIKQAVTIKYNEEEITVFNEAEDHNGHGTAIASILSKTKTPVDLYIIKIFDQEEFISDELLLFALEYIRDNLTVDIVHMSLGIPVCENKQVLYDLCFSLYQKGMILVSAFDNSGAVSYPAAFDCVIGVRSGASCNNIDDFEYIDDDIINIGGMGRIQRVTWGNPPYLMMGGNSFAAAHVTAKIISFLENGITKFDEILAAFRKAAKKEYRTKTCEKQRPLFEIQNAALFPFNKEMHGLVRFKDLLHFEIADIYDIRISGRVGTTVKHLLKDEAVADHMIKNIDDIAWDTFDTLILGHTDELLSVIGNKFDIAFLVETALKNKKKIFAFDNAQNILPGNNEFIYYPTVEDCNVPSMRFGMLYRISVPVVGIFGTSARQGKFTLQMYLRQRLLKDGYLTGQIGTEPTALLFGLDYAFPMGYNSGIKIDGNDVVRYLNGCINELCEQHKEIILVGSQSGSVPYDYGNLENYTIAQYHYLLGTKPDLVYLCINPYDDPGYIARSLQFIQSAADSKVNGLVVFPMTLKNDWLGIYGGKRVLEDDEYRELRETLSRKFDIPIYSLGNEEDIDRLYSGMIEYFSES